MVITLNGIYIHIPFCKSKCPYCDFYSQRCNRDVIEKYVDAIVDEITSLRRSKKFLPQKFTTQKVSTVYFGGGTPSILSGEDFKKIINAVKNKFTLTEDVEITVEANPASDIEELIPYFKSTGVNRVSLGMQSAVDNERKILGRNSDKERISRVIELLKENGISNISLDVMLGIPEQTTESLTQTLDFIKECKIPHVSAYMLKIEEGTFFHTHQDRYNFPSEDLTCDLYEECCNYLENAGYTHYEISNFALPGFQSKHNIKYWTLENYLGIGAAAHSFIEGKRFYNKNDMQSFIDGEEVVFDGYGNTSQEYVMLHLRLKSGFNIEEFRTKFGDDDANRIQSKLPPFIKHNLVSYSDGNISLTRKGFLLSNTIINELT